MIDENAPSVSNDIEKEKEIPVSSIEENVIDVKPKEEEIAQPIEAFTHDDDFLNEILEEEKHATSEPVENKKQNVTIESPMLIEKELKEKAERLTLPSDTTATVEQKLSQSTIMDMMRRKDPMITQDMIRWFNAIQDGDELLPFADMYSASLEKEDTDWYQSVDHNGLKLQPRSARVGNKKGGNLQGENAVLQILSKFGYGLLHQQPMWHSGIWLTFSSPSDGEIIELHRRLISDKIRWGRNDYGLSLSSVTTYTTDRLVEFALDHVHASTINLKDVPNNNLRELLVAQDIPLLLHGMAVVMFTNGFQFDRACTANPGKCTHVATGLVNVAKLLMVDRNALTPWQKEHMSNRASNQMKLDDVLRYQSEMRSMHKSAFQIKTSDEDDVNVVLKTPTISDFLQNGFKWIDGIKDLVEDLLGMDAGREEKEDYMFKQGKATALRQYRHWVDSIQFDENTVNEGETIDMVLGRLSALDGIRERFLEEATNYINRSTVSVVGIPEYDCPSCGGANIVSEDFQLVNHPRIIPLDVQRLFFYLLVQRSLMISER